MKSTRVSSDLSGKHTSDSPYDSYEHLGFTDSKIAVWNSVSHYLELVKDKYKSLGVLFLCIFCFDIFGLVISFVPALSGLKVLASLLSSVIWVFGPLIFVAHLYNISRGKSLGPYLLIAELGYKTFTGYIWTLLYLKLVTLAGLSAISIITIPFWIWLSKVMVPITGGGGTVLGMATVGLLFLIPLALIIAMFYFVGFAQHHYFFQPNTGFQPIRSSILFVKSRWAVIFWGWLLSSSVYAVLDLSFWFIGYLEGVLSASISLATSPGGIIHSMSQIFSMISSGNMDMISLPLLMNLATAFFSTNFSSIICSGLKGFLALTFWSHQFLYFMGFYHYDNWEYPKKFQMK